MVFVDLLVPQLFLDGGVDLLLQLPVVLDVYLLLVQGLKDAETQLRVLVKLSLLNPFGLFLAEAVPFSLAAVTDFAFDFGIKGSELWSVVTDSWLLFELNLGLLNQELPRNTSEVRRVYCSWLVFEEVHCHGSVFTRVAGSTSGSRHLCALIHGVHVEFKVTHHHLALLFA